MIKKAGFVKGIGINDFPGKVQRLRREGGKVVREWTDPFYTCWVNMLGRQTPAWQIKYPSYSGTTVDEEWHYFSKFRSWLHSELKGQPLSEYDLDKDILSPEGCPRYGPETCVLVPRYINRMIGRSILTDCTGSREKNRKFYAQIYTEGKKKHLGVFATKEEAHAAWQQEKTREIKRIHSRYQEDALVNRGVLDKLESVIYNLEKDISVGRITKKLF